jgi:hypothetical protein
VFYTAEGLEGSIAIPIGAFADPKSPSPTFSVYEERMHSWISMPPAGTLWMDGLSESVMFMKGTFDKPDIHPNFVHAGKLKSAAESYTRSEMSPVRIGSWGLDVPAARAVRKSRSARIGEVYIRGHLGRLNAISAAPDT